MTASRRPQAVPRRPLCVTPAEELARLDAEDEAAAVWLLVGVFLCGVVAGSLMAWCVLGLGR